MSGLEIGMLWFDGDHHRSLGQRIQRAAEYYETKYGARPDVCFLHPAMVEDDAGQAAGAIRIHTSASVLPDHFWLGVAQAE
jgi:hypothetical protein